MNWQYLPGKRLPNVAKGFARLRGNNSEDAAVLLVNISKVKPGYKNGLIVGIKSGVISSVSRSSVVWFFDCNTGLFAGPLLLDVESLDRSEETENMLGFFGTLLLLFVVTGL